MDCWQHDIKEFTKGGLNDGSYTIVGSTYDEKARKNIEWEFEVDSTGKLVHSNPSYLADLYSATNLDKCIEECINEPLSNEQRMRELFKVYTRSYVYNAYEDGMITKLKYTISIPFENL